MQLQPARPARKRPVGPPERRWGSKAGGRPPQRAHSAHIPLTLPLCVITLPLPALGHVCFLARKAKPNSCNICPSAFSHASKACTRNWSYMQSKNDTATSKARQPPRAHVMQLPASSTASLSMSAVGSQFPILYPKPPSQMHIPYSHAAVGTSIPAH